MKRHIAYAVLAMFMVAPAVHADVLTSGTATRVGESLETDGSTVGRSQIKVCGTIQGFNPFDMRTCTFHMAGDSPLEILETGTILDVLSPKRGGSANAVTFEAPGRPSLNAKFTDKNNGNIEFCIAIDRAITIAPAGITTEPCQDGDSAQLLTEFILRCDVGNHDFAEENIWRVAANCNTDFPNLRIIK